LLGAATLVIAAAGLALMAWDWSAPVPWLVAPYQTCRRGPDVRRRTVREHEVAGVELPHAKERERDPGLQILKERPALAEHDRADHDAQLVEETGLGEVGGQMRAAEDEQFLARISPYGRYVLCRLAADDGGP
jgi:hypothetical protein